MRIAGRAERTPLDNVGALSWGIAYRTVHDLCAYVQICLFFLKTSCSLACASLMTTIVQTIHTLQVERQIGMAQRERSNVSHATSYGWLLTNCLKHRMKRAGGITAFAATTKSARLNGLAAVQSFHFGDLSCPEHCSLPLIDLT